MKKISVLVMASILGCGVQAPVSNQNPNGTTGSSPGMLSLATAFADASVCPVNMSYYAPTTGHGAFCGDDVAHGATNFIAGQQACIEQGKSMCERYQFALLFTAGKVVTSSVYMTGDTALGYYTTVSGADDSFWGLDNVTTHTYPFFCCSR